MIPTYRVLHPELPVAGLRQQCALGVMIKAPRAGASKTRLSPPLTPIEAAELSACFLRDTVNNIAGAGLSEPAAGIAVYTPVGAEAAFDGMLPEEFSLLAQRGEAFGDRLFYATQDLLAVGYESLCLIDSDSPTLPTAWLAWAARSLKAPGDRVVLGPSADGGYYLIGLKRAHRHLFTDVVWSTEQVLAQTIQRAAEINLAVELLPTWYDVDDAASLAELCAEFWPDHPPGEHKGSTGYAAPHTRRYIEQIIAVEGDKRIWPNRPMKPTRPMMEELTTHA
ncbi:MAG: TIGR04282 family arsenosugar biosynthesis glycosyltransferase [Acidobacteriota bacterium]|nr:TIGR04282 family arsenosugar biosynthesis glycosyltransferase [Acidobacteriota bacterium]